MDGSFEAFVREHGPDLQRLARAMTRSPHDAADLTQEALARMGERWTPGRLDDPRAYAVTVMARLNVDRLRRWRREVLSATPWGTEPIAIVAEGPDVDWLPAALSALTPQQRTALALRYVDDLDLRGIAARMGCSEGTVKSHLSRGRDRLRAAAREIQDSPVGGE